jgi:sugar phosphate isomerase/epimerase
MMLSCLPVSLFPAIISGSMSIREWSSMAAAMALDAIDLSILFLKERKHGHLEEVRKEIEATGLRVALCNTYSDFTHEDSHERGRQLSQLKEDICAAARVGARFVRITAGQGRPGVGRDDGIRWVLEAFREASAVAQHEGITLVYENHSKPGVWRYADFSHPTDVFLEIADGIRDTPIGILFDTANPLAYGDDPMPVLEKVLDRVMCVHVADIQEKGTLKPTEIGAGIVPLGDLFRRLCASGFEGVISIEEASGMGEAGIKKAVEFVRARWQGAATETGLRRRHE